MISAQVVVDVLVRPVPLAILVVTLAAAAAFGGRLARRRGVAPVVGVLLLACVGVVLALTAAGDSRQEEDYAPAPGALGFLRRLLVSDRVGAIVTAPPVTAEQFANIALFVPVGLLAYAYYRSVWRCAGFATILSVLIETWQSYVGRSADLVDVRNNVAGALLGMVLFLLAGSRVRGAVRALLERLRIHWVVAAAAVAVAAVLGVLVLRPV